MFALLLATAPTALDKIKQVPPAFWLKVGIAVGAIVLAVVIIKKLAGANKVVVAVVTAIVLSFVGFSWIYERNEPAWATPVVEKLAGFFPSKGSYGAKQQTAPKP